MNKSRLEAFSDGVIAILITIMVLEIKLPEGHTLEDLKPLIPVFASYVLSFVYLGIYWTNHHHMLHTVKKVNGAILWSNLFLLFWLSLIPFCTSWVNEDYHAKTPMIIYGAVLFLSGLSYTLLQRHIIRSDGDKSLLKKAVGGNLKGLLSLLFYALGMLGSIWNSWLGISFYTLVALMWLIPDKRIEKVLDRED